MDIHVQRSPYEIEESFLSSFARTLGKLGHKVTRDSPPSRRVGLSVVWGVHGPEVYGPRLYVELGWLPRWGYQVSPTGINAQHHAARPKLSSLSRKRAQEVRDRLEEIKREQAPYAYMNPDAGRAAHVPKGFILVPLQVDSDINMEHAPEELRTAEGLIDALTEWNPPYPLVYKAHPNSKHRDHHRRLRPGRPQDLVRSYNQGNIHSYLSHTFCHAVVTVNSNTAHDALLWDVPVIALGDHLWPRKGPFYPRLPKDWEAFKLWLSSERTKNLRLAYVDFVMKTQWSLADASDVKRVREVVELACGRV